MQIENDLHSPWYYVVISIFLAILCSFRSWQGFRKEDQREVILAQSFLIYAIFCWGHAFFFYLYQSNLFSFITQDELMKIGVYYFVVIAFLAGAHGIYNKNIINSYQHFWFSINLLILCFMAVVGLILLRILHPEI